jgi:hypothetical protein
MLNRMTGLFFLNVVDGPNRKFQEHPPVPAAAGGRQDLGLMPRRWFRQVMDKGLVIAASGPASSPDEGYIAVLLHGATKIFGEDGKRYRRRGTGETEVPALPSVVAATEHMDPRPKPGIPAAIRVRCEVSASVTTADDIACEGEQAKAA